MPRIYVQSCRAQDFWTEEKTQQLRELWPQTLTQSQIGKILGCTKNAVQGKGHRIGLPLRPQVRPVRGSDGRMVPRTVHFKNSINFGPRVPKTLNSTPNHQESQNTPVPVCPPRLSKECCRWVVDTHTLTSPTRYCDQPAIFNKSYCESHHTIAVKHVPKRSRERHYTPFDLLGFG
jgi:GcrA cell cycle regulator